MCVCVCVVQVWTHGMVWTLFTESQYVVMSSSWGKNKASSSNIKVNTRFRLRVRLDLEFSVNLQEMNVSQCKVF